MRRIAICCEAIIIILVFVCGVLSNYFSNIPFNTIVLASFLLVIVIHFICKRAVKIKKQVFDLLIVFFIVALYNYAVGVGNGIIKLFVIFTTFLIGYIFSNEINLLGKEGLRYLVFFLKILLIIIVISCAFGLYESFLGNSFDTFAIRVYPSSGRLHSFYLHPIVFASIALTGIILSTQVVNNSIVKYFSIFICIYCMIFTLARGSWIAFFFTSVITLVNNHKESKCRSVKKNKVLETIIAIIVLIILLYINNPFHIVDIIKNRFSQSIDSYSFTYRFNNIITLIMGRIQDFNLAHWILGSGYHSSQKALGFNGIFLRNVGNSVVDNEYISVLYDFGIIGTFMVGISLYICIKLIIKKGLNPTYKCIALITLAYFIQAFFFDILEWNTIGTLFLVFCGIIFELNDNQIKPRTNLRG